MRRWVGLCAVLFLISCGTSDKDAPLRVSVIGDKAKLIDPNSGSATAASLTLSGAIAQGLVQHNAAGEIVPALAESWMVTDDGLSYIFRVGRQSWADGKRVSAFEVSASLRASLANASRNPLKSSFNSVAEIVAMTDRIIEVRLKRTMPNLLELFAKPEMAVMLKGKGSGPMRITETRETGFELRPALSKEQAEALTKNDLERLTVSMRGESAPKAISRFMKGDAVLVTNGGFVELPYLYEAKIARDTVRRDPVSGLFGLVASTNSRALGDAETRRALTIAIDRTALLNLFGLTGWAAVDVPAFGLADTRPLLAASAWMSVDMNERRRRARGLLGRKLDLKIILPQGPGTSILFAHLRGDFARIGVTLTRTIDNNAADLRLVDAVASHNSPEWYLTRLGCGLGFQCSKDAVDAIKLADATETTEARSEAQLKAVQALLKDQVFIPLATPLRWSLARPLLRGFRENAAAVHPVRWLNRANN